jgi:hypothetical protein
MKKTLAVIFAGFMVLIASGVFAADAKVGVVDLNKIVGNAMQLPEAISLAQQGRVEEAARIYSQITGMEHADAIQAVKSLASGHAVSLTPATAT